MTLSRLDHAFRSVILTKIFTKGWGNPSDIKRLIDFRTKLADSESCSKLVSHDYPVTIDKEVVTAGERIWEGHFESPLCHHLPGIMPQEVKTARFQAVLPVNWRDSQTRPIVIQLAGTGDHGFGRRRNLLARPLLKKNGIASVLLENPYYGCRKPKSQTRSSLHNVSDLFVMGGALSLESHVLLHWLAREGFNLPGLTGTSMGGHMACLAACLWNKPLVLVPCLSGASASATFTKGVLSGAVPWGTLEAQFIKDRVYLDEIRPLVQQQLISKFMEGVQGRRGNTGEHDNTETHSDSSANLVLNANGTVHVAQQLLGRGLMKRARGKNRQEHRAGRDTSPLRGEAVSLMRQLMEGFTDLRHVRPPADPALTTIVSASLDAYVPPDSGPLHELWPGCEVRHIDSGHISAFLLHQNTFRLAIRDGFEKMHRKYGVSSDS